uniref:Uncharacterized protein n=1 Tax=Setaria viridis TaxID=4556 RepID=A0A4U6VJL2_SETVI|nr:hypothetical protein SEVIR_3G418400v2 [Setaria viridis]
MALRSLARGTSVCALRCCSGAGMPNLQSAGQTAQQWNLKESRRRKGRSKKRAGQSAGDS